MLLYNTMNVSSPKLMEDVTVNGGYISARMARGYLYVIVQQPSYSFNSQGNATGFTLLGRASQYPADGNQGDSPNGDLSINRSVIIGGYLYTISQSEVMVSSLSSLSTVAIVLLSTWPDSWPS